MGRQERGLCFASRIRFLLLVSCAVILASCGGGGGGSNSTSGGGGSGGGGGGGGSGSARLDTNNAFLAAETATLLTEYAIEFVLATTSPIIEFINGGIEPATIACAAGGQIVVSSSSFDPAHGLQAGDVVEVRYENCISPVFDVEVAGRIVAEIESIYLGETGELLLTMRVAPQDAHVFKNEGQTTIGGSYRVTVVARATSIELLDIAFSPDATAYFEVIRDAAMHQEQLTGGSIRRYTQRISGGSDQPYTVDVDIAITSERLSLAMNCRSEPQLVGASDNDAPHDGLLACVATNGSRLEIDTDHPDVAGAVTLRVDPEGDGSYILVDQGPQGSPILWSHLLTGRLWEKHLAQYLPPAASGPPLVPTVAITLNFNDLVATPNGTVLYATTDSALLEISLDTLAILRTLSLAGTPGALGISRDGADVYVALDAQSEIARIDTTSLTVTSTFPLGDSSYAGGGPRRAVQVEVGGRDTDPVVVISTADFIEMVAYRNGAQLPQIISDQNVTVTAPRSFIVLGTDTIVAVDSLTSANAAFEIALDANTGLSVVAEYGGLSGRHEGRLQFGRTHFYTSGGRVFDPFNGTVEANMRPAPFGFYDDVAARNLSSGIAYALRDDDVTPVVDRYRENVISKMDASSLPVKAGFERFSHATVAGDFLVFARGNRLERVRLADLARQTFSPECGRYDMSGLLVSGTYTGITCGFSAAVYDAARNLIYAGRTADGGLVPGVVTIDVATWTIVHEHYYAAAPIDLAISDDGTTLFVVLEGLNQVGTIDLDAASQRDVVVLGNSTNTAYEGEAVDGTSSPIADFVVAAQGKVGAYADGEQVGNASHTGVVYDQLFADDDGIHFYGRHSDSIDVFDITAGGVSLLQGLIGAVYPRGARRRGDMLYFPNGTAFSLRDQATSMFCDVGALAPINLDARAVAPSADDDSVFVTAVAGLTAPGNEEIELTACDPATTQAGAVSRNRSFTAIVGQPLALLPLSAGKIALVTDRQALLLDRPD